MPSVLVIDDDLFIRHGLRSLLEQEYPGVFFGEARIAEEALDQVASRRWDLIILDIGCRNMAEMDGFFLLEKIRSRYFLAPVLTMSARPDLRRARRAQQMGADGYSGKDAAPADLSRAIRDVFAGRKHFSGFQLPEYTGPVLFDRKSLSQREHGVMLAIVNGKRATDIATELNLSKKTVCTYRRRLLDKLRLDSTADLVRHTMFHNVS
jgi:DNA-binding NarL/FixJ family response regulator